MKTYEFSQTYRNLLTDLHRSPNVELNARTKTKVKALDGGYSFKVSLEGERLPVAGNRKYWPYLAAADLAWMLQDTKDPALILKYAPKLWSDFVEDGEMKAAYGHRWANHFGRHQLEMAVEQLKTNPSNRQLYVSLWDPASDGLGALNQPKNIPCITGFSLTAVAGRLHLSVFLRSSDVFVGLPYDVMTYALLCDAIAATVGLIPGSVHFTLAHPHIYEPHFNMVHACVEDFDSNDWHNRKTYGDRTNWAHASAVSPNLPAWNLRMIRSDPDGYIAHVKTLTSRTAQNEWNPMPPVVV